MKTRRGLLSYVVVMGNLYSIWPGKSNEDEKNDAHRLLRKLRIALLFWLVSFILTLIWFTYSPAF